MKMMTFNDFKEKWACMPLRTNGYLSLGLEHPLNLQIGYSFSGYKSFVVMEMGAVSNIPSSFAIKAENVRLRNGTWILAFQLVHVAFEEEFLRLCWDMIEATAKSVAPQRDLIVRYLSWQKLLQYSSKEIMPFQRQKGLLGELLYLSDCLRQMSADIAVEAWTGPDGSDQDFVFEAAWAEVKAIALSAATVKISSMQQLEQEVPGYLVVYTLEKSTEGEGRITLPAIAEEIRSSLHDNPVALDRFEMKLFKYGYRSQDVGEYNKNYFRYIEKREYLVNDSFPKLCRENVAQEITACTYEISLSAIEPYRRT